MSKEEEEDWEVECSDDEKYGNHDKAGQYEI